MKCACAPCSRNSTMRVMGFLNNIQKQMLGYFCADCIKAGCTNQCRRPM